jgi:50S ribosome-binding GTPase
MQVLDARDPNGTRSPFLERHLRAHHKQKHLIFLLNKVDLVPGWVAKRWLHALGQEYPTLAFHASITKPFGKGALLSLLRQMSRLKSDRKAIAVGFVGYPNVGKSSVINTLRTKKVRWGMLIQHSCCGMVPVVGCPRATHVGSEHEHCGGIAAVAACRPSAFLPRPFISRTRRFAFLRRSAPSRPSPARPRSGSTSR